MKILVIHNRYQLQGGEDSVVEQEFELLGRNNTVEILYFQNYRGWKGMLQFIFSIWNIFSAQKVRKKILQFKPDVIHVHNWHFGIGPLIFRTIYNLAIPVVHTVHNYRLLCPSAILLHDGKLFTDSLEKSFPWRAIQKKVYRSSYLLTFWIAIIIWFHKKIGTWQKIDVYICLTSFAVSIFEKSKIGINRNKFVVKPNFKKISNDQCEKTRDKHFLFIGRLSEEKGIATLLNAFKELPYMIKIAGDGPLKEYILNECKNFANLNYIGNLSNLEVVKELQVTQALICPSICYEGMPMTILEAFSTSTPVITSNLGSMASIVSNNSNGFLFEAGNIIDLKETVLKFAELSFSEKEEIGKKAYSDYQTLYSPHLQQNYFNVIYDIALNT